MRVSVISLERSHERRAAVTRRLKELGIAFEFFAAVDAAAGAHLQFPSFPNKLRSRYGGHLTPGEAGCFASHALLWEECAASGRPILILEDNVDLAANFCDSLAAAQAELDRGAGFIRLVALIQRRSVLLNEVSGNMRLVRYLKGPSGGQAYVLSPEGARRLLDGVKRWAEPLDDYLDRFWVHGLPALAIHPLTVTRADVPTTIPGREGYTGLKLFRRRLVRNWDGLFRLIYNLGAGFANAGPWVVSPEPREPGKGT
ncbi:glycosyltransferase family 25 protein [Devosia sp.]|uniref:glycosyltransferase family 25 protein n=1 Tax=Devosia sp. TaxID=1871048 RepID=UPI00261C078D|nr:glycosyltransferase family 25 protein [Devosia sp.]